MRYSVRGADLARMRWYGDGIGMEELCEIWKEGWKKAEAYVAA